MASVEEICDEIALINHAQKILEGNIHDVKNRFKKNVYDIEMASDSRDLEPLLQGRYELLEKRNNPTNMGYSVRITDAGQVNGLLELFMQNGNILSFKEVLPTMNEIFIEQVQTFNQQNTHE